MCVTIFPQQIKQSPEAVEAYGVCQQFERLLAENLDFDRAYEATFTKDTARRRAIALSDGEFGKLDFTSIDDLTLITAYKRRMQIIFSLLPLAGPDSKEEEALFFPPEIERVFDRKPPQTAEEFRPYAAQLELDAARIQAHLRKLAAQYPVVAERLRAFKTEMNTSRLEPPKDYNVKPQRSAESEGGTSKGEAYYSINGYKVIREDGRMRIVEMKLFNRLF